MPVYDRREEISLECLLVSQNKDTYRQWQIIHFILIELKNVYEFASRVLPLAGLRRKPWRKRESRKISSRMHSKWRKAHYSLGNNCLNLHCPGISPAVRKCWVSPDTSLVSHCTHPVRWLNAAHSHNYRHQSDTTICKESAKKITRVNKMHLIYI